MENIQEVYLDHTAVEELPGSIYNLVGLERLYLRRCENLSQLPGTIGLLPKLEVIIFYKQRGFQLYEPCKVQKAVIPFSKVSGIGSDNDAIKVYTSLRRNITVPEGHILERNGPCVSLWFRKRFPEVTLYLIWEPIIDMDMHNLVLEFSIDVLINGTNLDCSWCVYLISETIVTTQPLCARLSLSDTHCQIAQDVLKRLHSVNEWNHIEVSSELKYHCPYDPKLVSEGHNKSIAGTIKRSTLVCKQNSCMEDIRIENPNREVATYDASCYCNETCAASIKI